MAYEVDWVKRIQDLYIRVVDELPKVDISRWLNYAGDDEVEVDGEMTPIALKRGSRARHMGRSVNNLNGVFHYTIYAIDL